MATPGATTVSAHTLYDIVRKLLDGAQVNIDGGGGQVILSADGPGSPGQPVH